MEAFASMCSEAGLPMLTSTVSKIEAGQRRVSVGEALLIAGVLGVDLIEMLHGEPIVFEVAV